MYVFSAYEKALHPPSLSPYGEWGGGHGRRFKIVYGGGAIPQEFRVVVGGWANGDNAILPSA